MPSPIPARAEAMQRAAAGRHVSGVGTERPGRRRLDVQGLRAVAVLMVAGFHAGLPIPGGFVGVDVFFVISGFVITAMLARQWASTGRIRFAQFYIRRFKRLTPALALVVTITLVLSALVLSPLGPLQTAAASGLGAMLLSANFVIAATTGGYFDAPAATNPLLNTWSLSVEEQFYLAFPALLALGWLIVRRGSARVAAPLLVAAVAVGSFGLAVAGSEDPALGGSDLLGFYSPFTRAWEFAVGALLYLSLPRLAAAARTLEPGLALLGAGALALSLGLITEATPFPGVWALLPVLGTALLILAGTRGNNAVSRFLASGPMVRIGDWSYSIYLWHWPFIVFAAILWPDVTWAPLAAALLSFVPAVASFFWLEQPIRTASLSRPRLVLLVVATMAPPLLLAGFLLRPAVPPADGLAEPGAQIDAPGQEELYAAAARFHVGNEIGCHNPEPISERSASDCTWNEFGAGEPIYLVGDSNADHFGEAVIGAGERLDRPVTIATIDTCPFFDVYLERLSGPDPFFEPCRYYVEETVAWLAEQPPGVVIISNSDEVYLDPDVALGLSPDSMTTDLDEKVEARADGLADVVPLLQESGHAVLLVQTVPHFLEPYSYEPGVCSSRSIQAGRCGESMPLVFVDEQQGAPREAVEDAAERTGAGVLDLWDTLCRGGTCSTRTDAMVWYRDSFHISVPASEALVPEFESAIAAAGSSEG